MSSIESKGKRICVFFSTSYPYETTLGREFEVISEYFDEIYYFPTVIKEGNKQTLPQNVILCTELADVRDEWKGLTIRQWITAIRLYLAHFLIKNNFSAYLLHFKIYIIVAARNVLWKKTLARFIKKNKLSDAVFYDYWFEDGTLALAILKKKGIIKHAYCRTHGFDLYDERWKQGRVPFREFKVKYVDKIFPVSEYGLEYFKNKIKSKYHHKLERHYLGVQKPIIAQKRTIEGKYIIVSAARTIPLKQIHKIPQILSYLKMPVHWIHFGDGSALEQAKKAAAKMPQHISCDFRGQVANEDVLDFYGKYEIDLFISPSQSEGLPISMMEVISYGIPIIAYDITALSEIVTPKTGKLLDINASNEEFSQNVSYILKNRAGKYPPEQIQSVYKEKFDYEKNYTDFARRLIELSTTNES